MYYMAEISIKEMRWEDFIIYLWTKYDFIHLNYIKYQIGYFNYINISFRSLEPLKDGEWKK